MSNGKLKLNVSNTQLLVLPQTCPPHHCLPHQLMELQLPAVQPSVVTPHSAIPLTLHIQSVSKSGQLCLQDASRICFLLPPLISITMIPVTIIVHLDFCRSLLNWPPASIPAPFSLVSTQKLLWLLKSKWEPVPPLVKSLLWLLPHSE